jgi:hypothetical protein
MDDDREDLSLMCQCGHTLGKHVREAWGAYCVATGCRCEHFTLVVETK